MQNLRYRLSSKENFSKPTPKTKPASKPRFLFFAGTPGVAASNPIEATRAQFAMLPMHTASNGMVADSQNSLAFLGWDGIQARNRQESRQCCAEDRRWNIYFGPLGTAGEIHNKKHQPGFSDWSVGGLAGFDYAFQHGGIGFLADYENIKASVKKHWGKFDIQQAHFSFYATYVPKSASRLSFDGIVGGGYDWYDIHRNTRSGTAKGTTQGGEFDALFGLAYNAYGKHDSCGPTKWQITPMANLQYIYLNTNKYNEHGAHLNDFKIHSQINKSLRSTLGTWISYGAAWENFSFTPQFYLAWQREYFDHHHSLYATPLLVVEPTQSLTVIGAGPNTLQTGLDLMFTMFNQYGIEVSYDFEWNTLFHDNAFYVGFNVEF